MWLDGLYMGQPFYAEYAMLFHEDTAFNDITRQFVLMEKHARDAKTGLLYHGWDESPPAKMGQQKNWPFTKFLGKGHGLVWHGHGRRAGSFSRQTSRPGLHHRHSQPICKSSRCLPGPKTGLWYDIVDKQTTPKNYREASASSMLIYALAKGVRKGYLPASYLQNAKEGYDGMIKEFIETEAGPVNLNGTVVFPALAEILIAMAASTTI